ncbi:hypothetical protein EYF80_068106 [Liparis tanakae]|uniref:Uncharacterized protein n=1 Tax=Liparis tanakae TaxID=230148 RepID=A0A4Z2E069_9TELE|nr:hypothetical protein EYF80_068106 [Liparis tanakae]
MMPGQLHDSLTSHRLSFMAPPTGPSAPSGNAARPHRLSLMPLPAKSAAAQPKGAKRASSTWSVNQTSPEVSELRLASGSFR